jgi:hypothetical protein
MSPNLAQTPIIEPFDVGARLVALILPCRAKIWKPARLKINLANLTVSNTQATSCHERNKEMRRLMVKKAAIKGGLVSCQPVLSSSHISCMLLPTIYTTAIGNVSNRIIISMVAFASLLASMVFVGWSADVALAAPTGANTVRTPFGKRPAANVHAIPKGVPADIEGIKSENNVSLLGGRVMHVNDEVHLVNEAGKVVHVAKNDRTKVRGTPIRGAAVPEESGWVAYASWTDTKGSPISSFTTTWDVPAVPTTNHGQTVFIFNSIEPASGNAILQPVLQFGPSAAGGGSYWAVASWYLVGGQTYYSSLVSSLSVGDSLNAVITLTGSSGNSYNYVSSFSNVDGTTLTATGADQLVWATETLEAYGITSSSDYPTGSTVFSSINLGLSNSNTPSVTWAPVSDTNDGLITTVNGAVTIKYPA